MAGVKDLDHVIEQYHLVAAEFIKGNAEPYKEIFSHREDMSLANPFGPPVRGWNELLRLWSVPPRVTEMARSLAWRQ